MSQIHTALPDERPAQFSTAYSDNVPPLELPLPATEELCADLASLGANDEHQQALLNLYETNLLQLQELYQKAYRDTMVTLRSRGNQDKAFDQAFPKALLHRFGSHASSAWGAILEELKKSQLGCCQGPDSSRVSHPGTNCRAHSFMGKVNRGHDSDAIRILEQAFNHSPNITQAEKFQLAEVTGLKPKQVTIWVCYRVLCDSLSNRCVAPLQTM